MRQKAASRRFLALLLSFCMLMSLGITAYADDNNSSTITYTVGTGGDYESISAAQTAASESGVTAYTIKLVSNITTTATVTVAQGTDVTIDLNGQDWTASTAGANPIYIKGSLTVTDSGSDSSEAWGSITSTGTGTNNGGLFYLPSQSDTTCRLTVNKGIFTCQSNSSANGVISAPSPTYVEINGGIFYGTKWGVISTYGQLVITDGEFYFTSDTPGSNVFTSAIFVTGAGSVNMTGGYIESVASGIYVAQSTSGEGLKVSDVTINCTSATYNSKYPASGIYIVAGSLTLDNVAIEGEASYGILTVVDTKITNSNITGSVYGVNATGLTDGSAVANVELNNAAVTGSTAAVRVAGVDGVNVEINDGAYTATADDGEALLVGTAEEGTVTVVVNSGTYSSDVSDYISPENVVSQVTGEDGSVKYVVTTNSSYYSDISPYRGDVYTAPDKEGYVFAGWYEDAEFATPIDESKTDGGAYAKFVDASVLSAKVQLETVTSADNAATNIRFVTSVDTLNYQQSGFKITFNGKTITKTSTTVYEHITGYTEEGSELYSPTVFSGESNYFVTYSLTNVPESAFDKSFTVVPQWKTMDGTTVDSKNPLTFTVNEYRSENV